MALGSLLLFLALLIVVGLILARPLIEEGAEQAETGDEGSRWLAERERVLDALAELDSDWQLGKVPEEIYATQREQLVAKGAWAIEEIERAGWHTKRSRAPRAEEGKDLEELIADYKRKVAR